MQNTSVTIAHAYVQLMIRLNPGPGQRRLHFCVQTKSWRKPPTVYYDWRHGCLFGISISRRGNIYPDASVAEDWIVKAIDAGYEPLFCFRKGGMAYLPNEIRALIQQWRPCDA
jgi:hypothetical protein